MEDEDLREERTQNFLNTVDYEVLKEAYWRRNALKHEPERLERERKAKERHRKALSDFNLSLMQFFHDELNAVTVFSLNEDQASKLVDLTVDYLEQC